MRRWSAALSSAAVLCGLFLFSTSSPAQPVPSRIQDPIDDQHTVTLAGNRSPFARAAFDVGPAAPNFRMDRMILVLQSAGAQRSDQWLSPDQFAARFSVSSGDVSRVSGWLTGHGFTIDEIPAGGQSIVFSGTAAQVEAAFHTPIHIYNVAGELHHANSADPQIPAALAGVVAGTVTLHDFRRTALHHRIGPAPEYTSGGAHYLAPADFAAIYDVAPLYAGGINGSGQTIAIAGRTNIRVSDVQTFRSQFALPLNNPVVVVNGKDPGIVSTDEETEADLDVEWSGAVAPMATVKFVVSASTSSTDGVDLSAQYIVNNNLAPVVSVSFGSCEAQMGTAERAFYSNLWQQAAAQGITALIASGDSGAAGCDSPSETTATQGAAINGVCSTLYSVCVGGTGLNENGNNSLYWSASNNASDGSALGYIPEIAWNESGSNGGTDLWSTGGGASIYYSKPAWQSGTGVPADAKRDAPDVSLAAAGHDGYLVDVLGSYYVIGGTSAASPSFAGLMALVNQKTGARQGNANTTLYPLASLENSGGAAIFHAITGGNNTVPGLTGFAAGPHYNQATGLGSADAFVLVNHWNDAAITTASFAISAAASSLGVTRGGQATASVTSTVGGGFSSAVSLSVTGLPSGVTASFAPASFAAPGSGSSVLTVAAAASTTAGSYALTITATAGTQTKTAALTLTVLPPFTLSASPGTLSIGRGTSGTITVTTAANSGFNAAIAFSVAVPSGIIASFSPASIGAPGSGTSRLTLTAASSAAPGTYSVTVTATSGSVIQSATVSLTVTAPASFTLNATPNSLSLAPGGSGATLISLTPLNGFSANVTVSFGALPSGVTGRWTTAAGGATLTFQLASSAAPSSYFVTITGTSPGISPSPTVVVTLNAGGFSVAAASKETVARGRTVNIPVTTSVTHGFSAPLSLAVTGLPSGVSAVWSSTTITNPASGASTATIVASMGAVPGTHTITITASSGGVSVSVPVSLTVE